MKKTTEPIQRRCTGLDHKIVSRSYWLHMIMRDGRVSVWSGDYHNLKKLANSVKRVCKLRRYTITSWQGQEVCTYN